jgi:phospholipid transport system substrate-binding protein
LAGPVLLAALCLPIAAYANQASEQFIRERAVKVVAVLNGNAPIAQKRDELSTLVDENVGIEAIAYYTLGKYRSGASEDELDRYVSAFKDYLFAYYIKPAAGFSGITLTVTGSTDLASGNASIVHTVAKTPGSTELDWYVLGNSSIVDVEIAGISAAKLLRAQVLAVIGLSGGKISAATDLLKTLVGKA